MQPNLLSEPLRLAGAPILRLQSDERLVRLVRAGSHPAFAEVVHRYRPALLRYTGSLVGAERAEDVVQHGLANAHTALTSDERPIELRPWLYRIVHNAALNALRGDHEVVGLDDHADELFAPSVEAQAEQRERFRSTLRAVEALPTAQRDALLLRELEGRSHDEIAAALGISPGAARQHLMRARVTMRAAVTALTPYPAIIKLATLGAGSAVGLPAAEVAAGAGVGLTLSKLGAGVLAVGALAGGAGVVVPSIVHRPATEEAHGAERSARATIGRPAPVGAARVAGAPAGAAGTATTNATTELRRALRGDHRGGRDGTAGGSRGRDDALSRRGIDGRGGRGGDVPSAGRDGRSDGGGSGGPGGDEDRGRPGPSPGGPDSRPTGSGRGGADGPGSGGSGTSGSDSGSTSGSDGRDPIAVGGVDATLGSGVSGSGSGGSGSGSSGSSSSGPGSSGSGSSGSDSTGPDRSGSSSFGSGSGSSGSDRSGSSGSVSGSSGSSGSTAVGSGSGSGSGSSGSSGSGSGLRDHD